MNDNPMFLKLAGIALLATAGSLVAVACSSGDDNAAPSTIEAGALNDATTSPGEDSASSGSSSGSSSGASSGSSSGGNDAGVDASATCDPTATVGGSNSYNTCSTFSCAGKYDNAANGVPNPLPPL